MQARSLQLHHKTLDKLIRYKKESEEEGAYRVSKRIHAILLNHDGKTSGEIASLLRAPRSSVSEWLKKYEEQGYEGLLEGYRSGRACKLSEEDKNSLADIIDSGPVAYGFSGGVWTSPMITKIIQEEFGLEYHSGHVRKILSQIGFSVQRPKRLLAKADPKAQSRWKRYIYPNIKKKHVRKERISSLKMKPVSVKIQRSTKHGLE